MTQQDLQIPTLAITAGEPSGIGPDLCVQIAQQVLPFCLVVIADKDMLAQRAEQLALPLTIKLWQDDLTLEQLKEKSAGQLWVKHLPLATPSVAGSLDVANGHYVVETLACAVQGCLDKEFDAMVTAPVHKGVINDAGVVYKGRDFTGHTEYLRDYCDVEEVVMMLATEDLRVALATTHLPLREVADSIDSELLTRVINILHHDLQKHFAIASPKILVAGLNPHAGEGGHLGREEIDIITPTLEKLSAENASMNLIGPLPADTLYTPKYLADADATLAMYHDQGLPVLKFHGFGRAANITLGLPIIRTSVDHGTALDLAGTGRADMGSLITAINVAGQMVNASRNENNSHS